MAENHFKVRSKGEKDTIGPRATTRVLNVLFSLASSKGASSLTQLTHELKLPKSSLHRILSSLKDAGYVHIKSGKYILGYESYRLAKMIIESSSPESFPACARPVIEWLHEETGETVILGVLSEKGTEVVYADVLVADSPLRYAVPTGDRRPLYSSASGKAILAYMKPESLKNYIDNTDFYQLTPYTTKKKDLPSLLEQIRTQGIIHERDGHYVGASAIASPVVNEYGDVFAAVVVAGPNDRLDACSTPVESVVLQGGERISRILGYEGEYPPAKGE